MTVTPEALDVLARRAKVQTITGIIYMSLLVVLELSMNIGIDLLLNGLLFLVVSVIFVPFFWYLDSVRGRQ